MKTIFTLFTSLLMSIAVFAAAKPQSILTIKSTGNADISIVLDGKRFDPNDNSIMLRGIDDGYHSIKVFREKSRGFFGKNGRRYEMVYNNTIHVKRRTHLFITIEQNGRIGMQESKIKKDLLPDAKVLLIVSGEATGCLDLTKIRLGDITEKDSVLVVHLPDPEICSYKIDHSKSKVYDTEYAFMDEAKLVDNAFQKAESQIAKNAQEMGILEQTKKSAEQILKPFIENVSKKKVVFLYALKDEKREVR